jgi:hypothetical protein
LFHLLAHLFDGFGVLAAFGFVFLAGGGNGTFVRGAVLRVVFSVSPSSSSSSTMRPTSRSIRVTIAANAARGVS